MPTYRIAFHQPPGEHRYDTIHFDAVDDDAALTHMAATWTREQVDALFQLPHGPGGGTQRLIWNRSVGRR